MTTRNQKKNKTHRLLGQSKHFQQRVNLNCDLCLTAT